MPETKITVTYQYLTDIWKNYDGSEQRRCLRAEPRRLISYDYIAMSTREAHWMRDVARKKQSNYDYVPMWHDIAYLSQEFFGGNTMYMQSEYMLGFHNCDMIEVFIKDDAYHATGANAVKKVRAYIGDTIRLKNVLNRRLNPKNAFVVPLIKCSILMDQSFNYIFSNGTNIVYNYEDIMYKPSFDIDPKYFEFYTDIEQYNRFNIPTKFNGRDVLTMSPQFFDDDNLKLTISKNVNRVDQDTGIFAYDLKNDFAYDNFSFTILLRNKKMINNMILFFNLIKGRYKAFYCPSWVNDFTPISNLVGGRNFIYVDVADAYRYYGVTSRKKHIIIFSKDWDCEIVEVSAVTVETVNDERRGKLIFTAPPKKSISLDRILMISYFNLVRSDSDDLKINYESNIAASVDLSFAEVDDK